MSTSAEESLSLIVFQNELRKVRTASLKATRDASLGAFVVKPVESRSLLSGVRSTAA